MVEWWFDSTEGSDMATIDHVVLANYFEAHKDLMLDGSFIDSVLYVKDYTIDDPKVRATLVCSVSDDMGQSFRGVSSSIDTITVDVGADLADVIRFMS